MDQHQLQQLVFFKYFIETIQKQQTIDLPTEIAKQSSVKELFQQHLEQNQEQLIKANLRSTNSISARSNASSPKASDVNQDDNYWERRRKNNEAAKRSRDVRRAKEDEMALRAALLEQENVKLRLENAHLKQENIQLRCQISASTNS